MVPWEEVQDVSLHSPDLLLYLLVGGFAIIFCIGMLGLVLLLLR